MIFKKKPKQRTYAEALADYRAKYGQTSGQKEVVLKQGTSKEEPQPSKQPTKKTSRFQKIKQEITGYKIKKKPSKFKKIVGAIGYKKQLSTNLQRQFTPPAPRIKKAPSQAQILQRKKFAEMVRRNAQLQRLLQLQQQMRNNQTLPSGGRGEYASTPNQPQQFRKPSVWNQDPYRPNNPFISRPVQNEGVVIPKGTPVWKYRRGQVVRDAGLFGSRQIVIGLPESFFN